MQVPALLAITAGDHLNGRDLVEWFGPLAAAGLPAVLLREPHLDAEALSQLVDAARAHFPLVVLHDRNPHARSLLTPQVALHLPSTADDLRRAPPGPVGVSCHTAAQVDRALERGAAYALLSPVWRPTSKPTDTRPPLGLDTFLGCARGRPVLALGGVDARRYQVLRNAGAAGAAVLGAVFSAADPQAAASAVRSFLALPR